MPTKYKPTPKDPLGNRRGSLAAKVNRVMTGRWQTVEAIQAQVKAPDKSIRRRLYEGTYRGIYEKETVTRFKLKKKK